MVWVLIRADLPMSKPEPFNGGSSYAGQVQPPRHGIQLRRKEVSEAEQASGGLQALQEEVPEPPQEGSC